MYGLGLNGRTLGNTMADLSPATPQAGAVALLWDRPRTGCPPVWEV